MVVESLRFVEFLEFGGDLYSLVFLFEAYLYCSFAFAFCGHMCEGEVH